MSASGICNICMAGSKLKHFPGQISEGRAVPARSPDDCKAREGPCSPPNTTESPPSSLASLQHPAGHSENQEHQLSAFLDTFLRQIAIFLSPRTMSTRRPVEVFSIRGGTRWSFCLSSGCCRETLLRNLPWWDGKGSLLAGDKVKRFGADKIRMCLLSFSSAMQNRLWHNQRWLRCSPVFVSNVYDDVHCS